MPTLLDHILEGSMARAVESTADLLQAGKTVALEEMWIDALALIVRNLDERRAPAFVETLGQLHGILKAESFAAREAFLCSAQLSMLGASLRSIVPPMPLAQLREGVLACLPEAAKLSADGQVQFARILPAECHAEARAFVQRVSAGLSRMWTMGNFEDGSRVLDYVSRKKAIKVPMPSAWPAPTATLASEGDTLWLLWGIALCYFGDAAVEAYEVFVHGYKRKHRNSRIGILLGVHMSVVARGAVRSAWAPDERAEITSMCDAAEEAWIHLHQRARPKVVPLEDGAPRYDPSDPSKLLYGYVPRG